MKKIRIFALLICLVMLFASCGELGDLTDMSDDGIFENNDDTFDNKKPDKRPNDPGPMLPGESVDLGSDDKSFGEDLEDLGAYDGYFEGASEDLVVTCVSGTDKAYKLEGNILTFTTIAAESVYSISGKFNGNIVIDVGDTYKFDLELQGLSLVCNSTNPITVLSGNEVAIQAKKDTKNYIYDKRAAIDATDTTLHSGALHSEVDLEIGGKGELTVVSDNNNGIHSKDDLQVKNLTLLVACIDNALKGNDSVEITEATTTLIASGGDCIKTTNSDLSEKGNQRGTITINGGTHNIYAACDGIDAAYNVLIDNEATALNIFTDKYSNYSDEVTATESAVYYVRYSGQQYSYSIKYINSSTEANEWVNAEYHSKVSGGRSTYYYYSFPKKADYDKMQIFVYSSGMAQGQEDNYYSKSQVMAINEAYDTVAVKSSGGYSYSWTNYTTSVQSGGFGGGRPGGPGGMQDGNTDKGDYSTKGIKAANEIVINNGNVNIKSYDDAIHANNTVVLQNGVTPLGNVTVNGGNVTAYSNDDGLHADGALSITAGNVNVTNSYEGAEGTTVSVSGGYLSIRSKDDGINATTASGTAITISGGNVYIYCTGDGIDSNSRASYSGIIFSGGNTIVISNSNGNSAIDTEQGYAYKGGSVIAIMPRGGMSSESTHCQNFSSIGKSTQTSLTANKYLVVGIGNTTATMKIPVSISSALVIVLGSNSPSVKTEASTAKTLDANGVAWN